MRRSPARTSPLIRLVAALVLLVGAGPAPAQADRAAGIAFRTPGSAPYILLDAMLGGRGPFTLLLDTGNATPFTVALTPEAARLAGARPGSGAPYISHAAVGGPVRLDPWTVSRLSVGPVNLGNIPAGVSASVSRAGRGLGVRLDGILGHNFLVGRVVAIDYRCRRVDLEATAPRTPPTVRFTFAPLRPLLLVPARINGRGPYSLVLDTGSGNTILSTAIARAAAIETEGRTELAGAGGVERDGRTGRAEVALGDTRAHRINIVVSGLVDNTARVAGAPIDGIAGMQLFAGGRLVLDYAGRRMWLLPPAPCRS